MPVQELPNSPAIQCVGYNDEAHCLSIWFRNGRRYTYRDVPRTIYDALCQAASPGSYIAKMIKGKFKPDDS